MSRGVAPALLVPLPLPLPFDFPQPLPPPGCLGVESASSAPLVSDFRWSLFCPINALASKEAVDAFCEPLDVATLIIFAHLVKSNNVRLLFPDLCQAHVAQYHVRGGDSQVGVNAFLPCVKPLRFVMSLPLKRCDASPRVLRLEQSICLEVVAHQPSDRPPLENLASLRKL